MPLLITLENAQLVLSDSQVEEIARAVADKIGVTQDAPLDKKQAAAALGISVATLERRIKAGVIHTIPNIGPVKVSRLEIERVKGARR
jgi:hypothetical protein